MTSSVLAFARGPISAAQPFCYLMAQEGGREGQVLEWLEVTSTGTFPIFEREPFMILEISWFAGYWLFGENDVEAGEGGALKCPISVFCGHITDCHKFSDLK